MREPSSEQITAYNSYTRKKRITLLFLCALTVMAALLSASLGSLDISVSSIVKTLHGQGDETAKTVILGIRLPRVTAAVVVGAILAMSGAVMQCVLQNPLESASTLGVSQGAAFGAALGIIVFGGGVVNFGSSNVAVEINNPYIVTLCAFVFGALSTAIIIAISRLKPSLGLGGIILAGVAVSSLTRLGHSGRRDSQSGAYH